MLRKLFVGLVLIVLTTCVFPAQEPVQPYNIFTLVGTARVEITPTQWDRGSMWLGGFAVRGNRPALGMDPGNELYATALVIRDNQGTKVLVAADILGFPRYLAQEIRRDLAGAPFYLKDGAVILNASHTHAGPALPEQPDPYVMYGLSGEQITRLYEYGEWLRGRIGEVVWQAIQSLELVDPYFASSTLDYAYNRRGGSIARPMDVPVLVFHRAGTHQPKVIVFSYPAHPIIMGFERGAPYLKYHPDYPGVAVRQLEVRYPGSMALFLSGASGDLNPSWPGGNANGPFIGYGGEACRAMGVALTQEVARVIDTAAGVRLDGPISPHRLEVSLPLDIPATAAVDYACVKANTTLGTPRYRHAERMLEKIAADQLPTAVPYPVTLWRFRSSEAPLILVGLAGEPIASYARLIADDLRTGKNPHARVLVLGYTNEVPGYLPTQDVVTRPGYEAGWNRRITQCRQVPEPRTQPIFAAGSMVSYGWGAPFRGRRDNIPGVQDLVLRAVRELVQQSDGQVIVR